MALILQIETSTSACSVALSENGKELAVAGRTEPNIHASHITLFIDEVMKKASVNYADLSAVAVSKGPGSYTGLRIGVSTAKGLSYALDIPLIAVNTLYAMASGLVSEEMQLSSQDLLCPMIDARRMEVYMALFNDKLNEIEPVQAKILESGSFDHYLGERSIIFFGDGAFKVKDIYPDHPNVLFADFPNSASHLTQSAYSRYLRQEFEDVAYLEPFYLKDFIAGKTKKI